MASNATTSLEIEEIVSRISHDVVALTETVGRSHEPSPAILAAVEKVGRLIDAARVLAAAPFGADPTAADQFGYSSAISAVASIAQVSEQAARARLAVARVTAPDLSIVGAPLPPVCPTLASAVGSGSIGIDAAVLVARQLDSVAGRVGFQTFAAAEQIMVDLAIGRDAEGDGVLAPVSVDFLAVEIKQLTAMIDPDGARPREERAERRRSVRIGKQDDDGLFPINGRVKPEIALRLLAAEEADRRSPRFVDEVSSELSGAADSRTPDKRMHDVLGEMVIAATSQQGMPRLDGAPVTVIVSVDEKDLNNPDGLDGDPIGVMAGSNVPVSRAQVERFIDAGGFRRVIKNSHGAVTGIGLPERCFTNPQRLATGARDGYRCSTPGCTSPHYALQMHHVIPYREGGPTSVDNAILLCYWCHSRVDTGPWTWRMINGLPEVRGPGYPEWTRLRPRVDGLSRVLNAGVGY